MDRLRQDLALALRGIRRAPGFAATVVLTIALGVGANGAMFSCFDRVFVRAPGGVQAPSEIRRLYVQAHDYHDPKKLLVYASFQYPHFESITAANSGTPIGAYDTDSVLIRVGGTAISGTAAWVSANYFAALGVTAVRGRLFGADEARPDIPTPVAIITHALWTTQFGADSAIVGRTIDIDKRHFTIIGVAAPGFTGIDVNAVDVFAPLNMEPAGGRLGAPWYRSYNAVMTLFARVGAGAREGPMLARSSAAYDHTPAIPGFSFDTTAAVVSGPIVQALGPGIQARGVTIGLRVAGVALALLLIACANVATLLLVRAT
ncbi:MAG: ABC transporter permease, partial [Gemmatimonadaceae bacterium]